MELIILECFAGFFLFLTIIRPLIRGLWKLPGLTVCPLLALGIIIGIFPAYGFRPECIPFLFFAIFLFLANLWDFLALFSGLQSDLYRDRGLIFTFVSAAMFAFTLWIAFHFAPQMEPDLAAEGIKTVFLQGGELHVRIYSPAELAEQTGVIENIEDIDPESALVEPIDFAEVPPGHPLLILSPPVAGSFTVSDEVCVALRERGFTVLSFSRMKFDSPSFDKYGIPIRLNIPGLYRLGNALGRGLSNVEANAGGRQLEETRKRDILFLLRELSENKTLSELLGNVDKNLIFLAGYGAGGAALTVLAGQSDFIAAFPQVQGIISIEAPLLSSLEGDPLPPSSPPSSSDPLSAFFWQAGEFIESHKERYITHITEIPRPRLPLLFLLSDRYINEKSGRYETISRAFKASENAALIAAVRGAGPFDYSSSPKYYPLYSFLFRGTAEAEQNRNWPELTASLITNFAVLVLENGTVMVNPDVPSSFNVPLKKTVLENGIFLEKGGVWQIPDVQTILHP